MVKTKSASQKKSTDLRTSRKQKRKTKRIEKKEKRHEYYTNRTKAGKFALKATVAAAAATTAQPTVAAKKKNSNNNAASGVAASGEPTNLIEQSSRNLAIERREQAKLRADMQKQRSRQLAEANRLEDKNIKRLEKQLKFKSRNGKIPCSLAVDGLDYLLEVCDSENIKDAVDMDLNGMQDDFQEDYSLMSGNPQTSKRGVNRNIGSGDADEESNEESNTSSCSYSGQLDVDQMDMDIDDDDDEDDDQLTVDSDMLMTDMADDSESESDHGHASLNALRPVTSNLTLQTVPLNRTALTDASSNISQGTTSFPSTSSSNWSIECPPSTSASDSQTATTGAWEDIYGRMRDKDGNVMDAEKAKYEKYTPPAARAQLEYTDTSQLLRLRRQVKGSLNRLAESNMHSISNQIEKLYMSNSRNDMNETLTRLMFESLITNVNTPERLLLEHVLLVAVLHANVGSEVGAHFLHCCVKTFHTHLNDEDAAVEDKHLDNVVNVIAQMYNFKMFNAQLLYDVLGKLSEKFGEKHIECILNVLRNVGFTLRKEDPYMLKNLILYLKERATTEVAHDNPRVKFMMEILLAIKNNNVNKIPNYDTSYSEHLKKISRSLLRKGNYVSQLNIGLDDLLQADERGKWWVVGSAWTGKEETAKDRLLSLTKPKPNKFSQKLLELAYRQRMNTDTRRDVFCIIMSAEDCVEAFEKLMRLGLKNQQEREIINVLLHCCLSEKQYNPYYAVLAQKFCDCDRKFQVIIKYSVWDKVKAITDCSPAQISNLAKLLTYLFLEKGLPISTLKVVQFGEIDKVNLRFIRQIMMGVLLAIDVEQCKEVFIRVSASDNLKQFRENLRLFIHHFLLRNLKSGESGESTMDRKDKSLLEQRAKMVEKFLCATDKQK